MIAEPVSLAEQVGMSAPRLRRIDALMQRFIDRGVISGSVTLVARRGRVAHLQAHGLADIESTRQMQTDALFRLASMTKPVIAVAILTLVEEGQLLLTNPVSNFLPTFKAQQVAVANAAPPGWAISDLKSGGFHLEPASREITIKDLLTHTSGMGSATAGPGFDGTSAVITSMQIGQSLGDVIPKMGPVPLSFQPGSTWEYSPLFGFDTLAHIVELVSGTGIDRFLDERIFQPLGMRDTGFSVPSEKRSRLAVVYNRTPSGLRAEQTPIRLLNLHTIPENRYYSGGGGLAGTAEDYARFGMMLANGGQLDGERVLSRSTVALMAANHIGAMPVERAIGDMRGYRFGLGVRVVDHIGEANTPTSRGTFGWAGAFGTNSWIDPVEQMVGLMMIQRLPTGPTEVDLELRSLFPRYQMTAYQALDD
ncbi:MAG TPA: serine hydrolase domain-containing protein [Chloroflexota bacterium]